MQTKEIPTILESSHPGASHTPERTRVFSSKSSFSSANPLHPPSLYPEHWATAADTAFKRRAGQAMHILALPPPILQPQLPFGRRQELGSSLGKFPHRLSPARSEQHSYPSPPMSDSHSPARHSSHIVEPEGHPYSPRVSEPRRTGGLAPLPPPPPQSLYDPRSTPYSQSIQHQRPLYPGEQAHAGGQMFHYQPQRTLESPSYGGMHIAQNYPYGYPGSGVPSHLGGYGPGPQGQPSSIPPPSLRATKPARRTKAHVASACVNCKKAHLSCDVQRPCGRCVASGKQDSCKDVQHKKRGRPRLRDDKEFGRGDDGRPVPTQLLGASPALGSDPYAQQLAFPSSHRVADPPGGAGRPTRGLDDDANARLQSISSTTGGPPTSVGNYGEAFYATGPNSSHHSLPVAFLNLDLVVLKSNQAFQNLIACREDIRGRSLMDLLEARQVDVLQRIRNELREERDDREPTYMAPITPLGQDPIQSVAERDVDHVSQGFIDRPFMLNFRLPNNHYQSFQTQIRLAKTSMYFVSVVVHLPPRPTGPPLLTQQLAPPTPIHASQTLSAPTTAPPRDFGPYSARPSSSASSAPTSPYFNFSTVRTSLPTISSSSYGNSPSYNYSPTAGPEHSYFSTIQPPAKPSNQYPSPYPPLSRTSSITSQPLHELNRPARLDGLQLPPIRTGPVPPLGSPLSHEFSESTREQRVPNVRKHDTSPSSADANPNTPDIGKRRRLNIHAVLE